MRNIRLIALREYFYNFRRRSFLFTAFGVPLFSFVMMFLIFGMVDRSVEATGQFGNVGYVDQIALLTDPVAQPEEYVPFETVEEAHSALLAGEIGVYFVIPEDFFNYGRVEAHAFEGINEGIENQLNDFIKANLARRVLESVSLDRLLDPMNLNVIELSTGKELDGPDALMGKIMTPMIFAMIFLMAVNTTSQFLMSGVVEEKENRMMEILITSATPLEMLWGKVLGLGLLGLTQVVVWGIAGAFILNVQADSAFFSAVTITPEFLVIGFVYLILGYFLFGAIMAGVGASVTADQEGRQFAGIFTLVSVVPLFFSLAFFQDPNGTLPVVLSMIPLTAPLSMIMRLPLGAVPAWQVAVSLVILALTVFGVVWLASQVFRLGLLMYGKRLSLKEVVNALRQGRRVLTTASHTGEGN